MNQSIPESEVATRPTPKTAARVLCIQAGLVDYLKAGDKKYRESVIGLWDTGDTLTGRVGDSTVGTVRRQHGNVIVTVVDSNKLMAWADEHQPDAFETIIPEPTATEVEVAGIVLWEAIQGYAPVGGGWVEDVTRAMLKARDTYRQLIPKRVNQWLDALKAGEHVLSATADEPVPGTDGVFRPMRFTKLPGVMVSQGEDKLVVTPNRKALEPVLDKILGVPELKQVEA